MYKRCYQAITPIVTKREGHHSPNCHEHGQAGGECWEAVQQPASLLRSLSLQLHWLAALDLTTFEMQVAAPTSSHFCPGSLFKEGKENLGGGDNS